MVVLKIEIIEQQDCPNSNWSGGTTTQLYIYPQGLTVKDEFLFRISSATVVAGESLFSDFSKYQRFLTTLKGDLWLQHNSNKRKLRQPFEPEFFDGAIKTCSYSDEEIIDFNIIWRKELQTPQIRIIDARLVPVRVHCQGQIFIYNYEKNAKINLGMQKECTLEAKQLLVSKLENNCEIIINGRVILFVIN